MAEVQQLSPVRLTTVYAPLLKHLKRQDAHRQQMQSQNFLQQDLQPSRKRKKRRRKKKKRGQLDSGWEEASQGASDYQDDNEEADNSDSSSEVMEDVSYEGDPDDPDQAAKQWSEHEWSSQQQFEG